MKFSACIEWLFAEDGASFPERIRRASAADLDAVEFWGWRDKDIEGIRVAIEEVGLPVAAILSEPTGRLVDRSTHETFLHGVSVSAPVAAHLGGAALIVVSGDAIEDRPRAEQRQAIIDALRAAAPVARDSNVSLVLEPINLEEAPANYLSSVREGLDIVEEIGAPNVLLLADLYHASVMGEDVVAAADGRVHLIGHVHVADHPGRHEPGTGGVDWQARLRWIAGEGYEDFIGLEYMPTADTERSLEGIRAIGTLVG
jgi:hydroxypyruvate isomerase